MNKMRISANCVCDIVISGKYAQRSVEGLSAQT